MVITVDCVGQWSDFGSCDATCGTNIMKRRSFQITNDKEGSGNDCVANDGDIEEVVCAGIPEMCPGADIPVVGTPVMIDDTNQLCSGDLTDITDANECLAAVESLGSEFSGATLAFNGNNAGVPKFCSYRARDKAVHFNGNPEGRPRGDLKPICLQSSTGNIYSTRFLLPVLYYSSPQQT